MVSRRANLGERSETAPDRGGKLQSAGGAAQSNVSPLILTSKKCKFYLKIQQILNNFNFPQVSKLRCIIELGAS